MPKMRTSFAVVLALLVPSLGAAAPVFELRALGVLGGDLDGNLSCYLLGRAGDGPPRVMIDGGTVVPGIVRWKERDGVLAADASWSRRTAVAVEVLRALEAILVTHAHLDHVAGFAIKSTLDFTLAAQRPRPFEVIGLPATLTGLRALFSPPLWVDFTSLPSKEHPALRLSPLTPGTTRAVGPFEVQAIPLQHPIPSAAFLVRARARGADVDAYYLHLGDSGATTAVWQAAAALPPGQLRAIAVDISFPARQEALAALTGHLTRNSLLLELTKLAPGAVPVKSALKSAADMTDEDAVWMAERLASRLGDLQIIAIHIKAATYDDVVRELEVVRRAGLKIVVPQQGELYRF